MDDGTIRLRELESSDHLLIVKWRNASHEYFFSEDPVGLASHSQFMKRRDGYYFVIERLEDSKPIGAISLHSISHRHKRAEYGRFLIAPDERRKGCGKRALRLLLQFAFQDLGLFKVYGDILAFNTAAIELNLKLGFFKEARLIKHVLKGERYHNVIRMAMFPKMLR